MSHGICVPGSLLPTLQDCQQARGAHEVRATHKHASTGPAPLLFAFYSGHQRKLHFKMDLYKFCCGPSSLDTARESRGRVRISDEPQRPARGMPTAQLPLQPCAHKMQPQCTHISRGLFYKGTLLYGWWEWKLMEPLWNTVQRCLRKLKIELLYDPAIPLLGKHMEKTVIQIDTCIPTFTAALFTIART